MSFGFDVGNFADAAHLAYLIYRDCYKVARGAPQEFQLLVSEVSTLSNSLKILQEDVQDPESSLIQAGDDRVKLVNDMVGNIRVTLKKMEKIALKYEIMGSNTASKRKQMWTRFKFTFDWSMIESLRSKLNQHNTMMSLLLTQIGNSSLQKIQSSTNALESDIHAIRNYIVAQQGEEMGDQRGLQGISVPSLSLADDESLLKDDITRSSMSASLLKHAEMYQPWSTIGDIRPIATPGSTVPKPAFLALIKASWILIDIIACHPQVSFVSISTRAQITALSTAIKREFEKIKLADLTVENLRNLNDEDLYIWEGSQGKVLSLRPQIGSSASSLETIWAVEGNEKAFFSMLRDAISCLNICIVMFLVQFDGRASRLVAKQQNGEVMLNIRFTKPVQLEIGRDQIKVNFEEIMPNTKEDAQRLSCLIEAANIYHLQRKPSYFSVQAFTFWLILVALKNDHKELVSALHPALTSSNLTTPHNDELESRLYQVTTSLVETFLDGDTISGPRYEFHGQGSISARGLSLLYWAIWIGNPALVNLLMLESVTSLDNPWHDLPPLHISAQYGHDAVARTIVANSSKDAKTLAQERDRDGRQALYHAGWYGHEKVARSLLRWGAEVDNISIWNHTVLHMTAENGHASVVQLLLDKGAKQEARDIRQMTPLLLACELKRENVIALFAEEQLDFTFRDDLGITTWQTAISIARGRKHVISQSTFDLIMQSFWAGEKPQTISLRKQRRAIVSFELDTDWVILTLDSRYARFEHQGPLPSHITDMFGRSIDVRRPAHVTDHFFKLTIEFHIIYACETLDFSTAHGTLATGGHLGWTRLKIRGGGEFKSSIRDHSRGLNFRNYKDIPTDPNAEEIS